MGNKSSKPRVSASSSEEEARLRLHKEKELEKEREEEAVRQKEKEEAIARQTDEAAIKIQSTARGKLAKKEVEKMLSGKAFGDAGKTVVIEEFLKGIECSAFIITDGQYSTRAGYAWIQIDHR
jgi:phosphoribosylamine-glycine ligase